MSYVIAGYIAVLGVLGIYAARLVLRSREAASRLTRQGTLGAPTREEQP